MEQRQILAGSRFPNEGEALLEQIKLRLQGFRGGRRRF